MYRMRVSAAFSAVPRNALNAGFAKRLFRGSFPAQCLYWAGYMLSATRSAFSTQGDRAWDASCAYFVKEAGFDRH